MAEEGAGPGGLDGLEHWAAEARAREAAEIRVRERWLRTQAQEDARLAQVLAGLAERGEPVTISTASGRLLTGRLVRVGCDFVAMQDAHGVTSLVALAALAWCGATQDRRLRPEPAVGPDGGNHQDGEDGDAAARPPAALADVLAQAVARRPRVVVHTVGASVSGELRGVGVDVMVVETAGEPPGIAYVRLPSVSDISFLDSG